MRKILALKILALTVVGAVSLSSMVTAMAEQTPQNNPNQAPSSQSPSSPSTQAPSSQSPSSPSTQAPSSHAPANQIDSARTQSNEQSLTQFWTPERLREARPMPTPRVDPDEVKK
jgi:cytoskeletal protein RodZ